FEVPDPLELPRVGCAVVPLVRARCAVVDERIPGSFPRLAAVVRALDDLSEPAARLGGIDSIRVGGGSLEMINLPATKVGAADVPAFKLPVRRQDEGALSRANEYPYLAHSDSFVRDAHGISVASSAIAA